MERLVDRPSQDTSHLVQVALPVGLDRSFAYSVPEELREQVEVGVQVVVPFRRRRLTGVVVSLEGTPPPRGARPIASIPDSDIVISEELLDFTRWIADYYGAAWGDVLRSALPSVLGRKARQKASPEPLHDEAVDSGAPLTAPVLTGEQSEAVSHIVSRLEDGGFGVVVVEGVTGSGKTEVYMHAADRVLAGAGQALVLVPEISISVQLLDAFRARFGERVSLFHSDLPQTARRRTWHDVRTGRCRILVGARSALFAPFQDLRLVVVDEEHEAAYKQSEQPRYHARDGAVMRARMNGALAVLGSATPSLETAHNAEVGRYERVRLTARIDGRLMATVEMTDMRAMREEQRAQVDAARRERRRQWMRERAARIMGAGGGAGGSVAAATVAAVGKGTVAPEVASFRNEARGDQARSHDAHTDVGGAPASDAVGAADAPGERPEPHFVSERLLEALSDVLRRGEQAILLVGRRGHATFVQCTVCGVASTCRRCDVSLVYHAADRSLRCHHCGRRERVPSRCPDCQGADFWFGGVGTQRVQSEIRRRLPAARVIRMDLDSTRGTGSHRRLVESFARGEADILLGTQMVAKGLHFPRVSLVGVVSADSQLNLPDFRAGERTFQLLTQVAGRAGRGDVPGHVLIQTYLPEHPAIQAAAAQDYGLFYEQAIEERRELGYPPIGVMARFLVDGPVEEEVIEVADAVGTRATRLSPGEVLVMGPAPLPLARIRGRHRWHVTLLGRARSTVHRLARAVLAAEEASSPRAVRLHLDMDPVHLM